jgi:NADH-quinone oxidoreductase subunit G
MPTIFIDGRPIEADSRQTVIEAALANGVEIPHFCWHPQLSIAGNCRICVVQVEGRSWVEIACNMPVTEGLRVLTSSDLVKEHRKAMLQLVTLNHPVDCGICDKAGECRLQDYHYAYNGAPSASRDPKVRATKFHPLSERIILDNERCILCSRCVRFTREVSKSNALGIVQRGDASLVRAADDHALDGDPYSDNVIDICPVGALLSRDFLYRSRVWYLEPTPSVCPGCARGCTVEIWHRKADWKLHALDARQNARIERVTPLDNPAVNGPWICNKGRDLAKILERPRARQAMARGSAVGLDDALADVRTLLQSARRRVAIVSSWGSNEELRAFHEAFEGRFDAYVKSDHAPAAGEVLQDDLLLRADKNPNMTGALALFPALAAAPDALEGADLLLIWGEGFDLARAPAQARTILLRSFEHAQNAHADVFIPVSIQTERRGHYTNFEGTVSAFSPCFEKPAGILDAETLFAMLAQRAAVPA